MRQSAERQIASEIGRQRPWIDAARKFDEVVTNQIRAGEVRDVLVAARRRMDDRLFGLESPPKPGQPVGKRSKDWFGRSSDPECVRNRHQVRRRWFGLPTLALKRPWAASPVPAVGARARGKEKSPLQQALIALPTADAKLLLMRHVERIAPAEIAVILGVSERTVKCRLLKALLKVQGLKAQPF